MKSDEMKIILVLILRTSSDFYYERNVVLGDHLKTKTENFPWRASASESLDLEIFVNPEPVLAYTETFTIHPTDELPTMLLPENIFGFTGKRHLEVLITPSVIRSDRNLETLAPSDRSCYFEGERKLRFFKIYTKRNCEIECFSKNVAEICDCIPLNVVRDPDTRVCSYLLLRDTHCYTGIYNDFIVLKPTEMLTSCSCLPSCESVSYSIDVRESKYQGNE